MIDPATDIRLTAAKTISSSGPCFIIAEIGQNHQGNFAMAKKLIRIAKVNLGTIYANCTFREPTLLPNFCRTVVRTASNSRRAVCRPSSTERH